MPRQSRNTAECYDFGNPVYDRCVFCADRMACEEEMQANLAQDKGPIIDVTPFTQSDKYAKIRIFLTGVLIGASGAIVALSTLGALTTALITAAVFFAGYMVGADQLAGEKKRAAPQRRRTTRRTTNSGRANESDEFHFF